MSSSAERLRTKPRAFGERGQALGGHRPQEPPQRATEDDLVTERVVSFVRQLATRLQEEARERQSILRAIARLTQQIEQLEEHYGLAQQCTS